MSSFSNLNLGLIDQGLDDSLTDQYDMSLTQDYMRQVNNEYHDIPCVFDVHFINNNSPIRTLTQEEDDQHSRYVKYVESGLISRISGISGVVIDESKLMTTHTEKMYTIRPIDNPIFSLSDPKETIYTTLETVIQKYYSEIEKLKIVFCNDRNLYILLIQALPINVTGDKHEMRMLITVAPE